MPKVFIVDNDTLIEQMFIRNGWTTTSRFEDAEYVQFTGGADVDPMLYGEPKHPRTYSSPDRDSYESHLFHQAVDEGKKLLGICRGGQFLNVMSGGSMYQDVNNHAINGTHPAHIDVPLLNYKEGDVVEVTSTHHQMMRPGASADILLTAKLATRFEDGWMNDHTDFEGEEDIEVLFYHTTNALCFQPHPEYVDEDHECQVLYFNLIKELF